MRTETATTTVGAAVRRATTQLRDAGIETPSLDARLLAAHVLGLTPDRLLMAAVDEIGTELIAALDAAIQRRTASEPVSRILGHREFWGRTFEITPATLDPRPETETLIEAALGIIAREELEHPRLLDIGTGTGCILLTLLAELPNAAGTATDISEEALQVAQRNANRLGVANRAQFHCTDLLEGVAGPFDIVLSNPPYIRAGDITGLAPEVSRHDPRLALDGGPDGLAFYRRIVSQVSRTVPGGWIILEVGSGQAASVLELAKAAGAIVEGSAATYIDLGGHKRCVAWKSHT